MLVKVSFVLLKQITEKKIPPKSNASKPERQVLNLKKKKNKILESVSL